MDLSYILNHLGENRDEYFGAVAPPVIQSSNFYFKTVEQMRNAFVNEQSTSIYTRGHNPTIAMTAQKLQQWKAQKMLYCWPVVRLQLLWQCCRKLRPVII